MMRSCCPLALAFAVLLAPLAAAAADDPDRRAVAQYNRGVRLYSLGRYDDSAAAFERAYLLNPKRTALLYNVGFARWKLGELQLRLHQPFAARQHLVLASEVLRSFVARRPDDPERPKVERLIATIDNRAELIREAAEPAKEPRHDGESSERDEPAAAKESAASPQPVPAAIAERIRREDRYTGIGFGVGGLASIVASVFLLREASNLEGTAKSQSTTGMGANGVDPAWVYEQMTKVNTLGAIGWVSLATGITSIAVGFYFVARPVRLHLAPAAGGASLTGRF